MLKFIKDFLSPIVCVLTVIAGMSYSSGAQNEKIKALEAINKEFKTNITDLSIAVDNLSLQVARLAQRLDDQKH